MIEYPRFGLVLLLVAVANLATDLSRLLLELSRTMAIQEPIRIQARPHQQDAPAPASDVRQPDTAQKPDTTQKPDTAQKKVEPKVVPDARGPPRGPRGFGDARAPFSPLPPDFSIRRPPWCPACGPPIQRHVERRPYYGW